MHDLRFVLSIVAITVGFLVGLLRGRQLLESMFHGAFIPRPKLNVSARVTAPGIDFKVDVENGAGTSTIKFTLPPDVVDGLLRKWIASRQQPGESQ